MRSPTRFGPRTGPVGPAVRRPTQAGHARGSRTDSLRRRRGHSRVLTDPVPAREETVRSIRLEQYVDDRPRLGTGSREIRVYDFYKKESPKRDNSTMRRTLYPVLTEPEELRSTTGLKTWICRTC